MTPALIKFDDGKEVVVLRQSSDGYSLIEGVGVLANLRAITKNDKIRDMFGYASFTIGDDEPQGESFFNEINVQIDDPWEAGEFAAHYIATNLTYAGFIRVVGPKSGFGPIDGPDSNFDYIIRYDHEKQKTMITMWDPIGVDSLGRIVETFTGTLDECIARALLE